MISSELHAEPQHAHRRLTARSGLTYRMRCKPDVSQLLPLKLGRSGSVLAALLTSKGSQRTVDTLYSYDTGEDQTELIKDGERGQKVNVHDGVADIIGPSSRQHERVKVHRKP